MFGPRYGTVLWGDKEAFAVLAGSALGRSTPSHNENMTIEVSQRQLGDISGEIMRGLDHGETYVVTRDGVLVDELTPLRRHRFVSAEVATAIFKNAPRVETRQLRENLDAGATQEMHPRG